MSDDPDSDTLPPWHERTSTVVGYSIAALITLMLMYFAVSCVASEYTTPDQGPQYFLDPGASTTSRSTRTTTTTPSTYRTSEVETTDVDGDTTTSSKSNATTRRRTPDSGDDSTTTSRRPRQNETRQLNPPAIP